MFKYIIFSIISFTLGLSTREIIDFFEKKKHKKRFKKVTPLSKQNFKKAMKDLKIK